MTFSKTKLVLQSYSTQVVEGTRAEKMRKKNDMIKFWILFFVRDGIYNSAADYNSTWRMLSVCLSVYVCVPGQTSLADNF